MSGDRRKRFENPWHIREILPIHPGPETAYTAGIHLQGLYNIRSVLVDFDLGKATAVDSKAGFSEPTFGGDQPTLDLQSSLPIDRIDVPQSTL